MDKNELSDRLLFSSYISLVSPGFVDHHGHKQMIRTGSWGSCCDCPREQGEVYIERCVNANRYDHRIHSVRNGKFFEYGKEIDREFILQRLR